MLTHQLSGPCGACLCGPSNVLSSFAEGEFVALSWLYRICGVVLALVEYVAT